MYNIAYIDDSEVDRYLATEKGFLVYEPEDYKAAKDNDIIVIDIMLGSIEILKEIVEYFKVNKPIVMISGLPYLAEFYEVDNFPVLTKPITKQDVIEAVNGRAG